MKPEEIKKSLCKLTPADFKAHPVWAHKHEEEGKSGSDDLMMPVTQLPVHHLKNKVIGVQVRLTNGQMVWAKLSNILPGCARRSEQFLHCRLEKNGEWFPLARYFDPSYKRLGPEGLAKFLGLTVDEIFPISYDLRPYMSGNEPPVWGEIPKEPREKLTRQERSALPKLPLGDSAEDVRRHLKWMESRPAEDQQRMGIEKIREALAEWEKIERAR